MAEIEGANEREPSKKKKSTGIADFLGWLGIDGGVFGAIKTITEDGASLLVYLNWVSAFTIILYISVLPIAFLIAASEGRPAEQWFENLPEGMQIFLVVLLTTAVMMVVAFGWLRVQDVDLAEKSLGFQLVGGFCGFAILLGTFLAWRSLRD